MATAPDEASHSEESFHSEPTSTAATTHSSEHPRNETSAAANVTTPPSHPPEDEFAEPQLAALHAIFPDFDAALLQSVLESVGGNQGRAVDALLGMSDPDYVPSAQEQAAPRSQTELDEEFARQLMLEEQQQQQQQTIRPRWQPSPNAQSRPQSQSQPFANATYDSRTGAPQTGPQKDTMAEVQEQFTKFAETGKRTFSSIVSKVKAKVQEFDQQRSGQGAAGTQPSWGSSSTAPAEYDRHSQQAYHSPAREEPRPVRATYPATQGYDLTTPSSVSPSSQVVPSAVSPPITSNEPSRNTTSPGLSSSTATPPPPTTNSGPPTVNIDPSKVGLLPKRPVSLIRPSDQSATQSHILDDDKSEDLEYMENPFEDHGRK